MIWIFRSFFFIFAVRNARSLSVYQVRMEFKWPVYLLRLENVADPVHVMWKLQEMEGESGESAVRFGTGQAHPAVLNVLRRFLFCQGAQPCFSMVSS